MTKALARGRLIWRAMSHDGALERLLLSRAVLQRASAGLFGRSRFAPKLDARIADAMRHIQPLSYRQWLQDYQPNTAPSPDDAAGNAPACVVLYPAGVSAVRLARCLRALRQQDRPFRQVLVLGTTPGARLAAKAAARLTGQQGLAIVRRPADLAERLDGDVLLLKGAPVLRARALGVLAAALRARPAAAAAYADEDSVGPGGFSQPFFKPDRSPVLGRQYDYVGNVALFRRDFFLHAVLPDLVTTGLPSWIASPAIGGDAVVHVPEVLHSEPALRRLSYRSGPAFDHSLAEAARASPPLPSVCVVIPTKDRAGLLQSCVDSIFGVTEYDHRQLSVVIVDNGSSEAKACRLLRELRVNPAITVLQRPGAFNYSWLCNEGAAAASADILVFMNNDVVIRDPDWIAKLAGAVALPSIGVVGCKLLYPTGQVQHAGVVLGILGLAGHIGVGVDEDDGVYCGLARHTREMSAVTGALVAIRAELFRRAGGYDERLAVAFSDIALCLTCNGLGHQTLCLQSALAYHVESASRGRDDHDERRHARLQTECLQILSEHSSFKLDPFYSPNLSLVSAYTLADPPRRLLRPVRPTESPRVLMLSSTFQIGHGVAVVIDILSRSLQKGGCSVFIGAPTEERELPWPAEQRYDVSDPQTAARLAAALEVDAVIAHTPPFFGVFKVLPTNIAAIAYDYGEPPPALFPDAVARQLIINDKFISMHYADRVLAISDVVRDENPIPECGVLGLGNTHLARWKAGSAERRLAARARRGWKGQLVLLNVCRFHEGERFYKGIDFYITLRRALELLHPEVAAMTRHVLAGKAEQVDVDAVAASGLDIVANPTDAVLADLYHACDVYMSFSRWEGYNLGIGQALALGLPVVASDIPAHRAFGVPVIDTLAEAVQAVVRAFHDPARAESVRDRIPILQEWGPSGERLRAEIDGLLARRQVDESSGGPR